MRVAINNETATNRSRVGMEGTYDAGLRMPPTLLQPLPFIPLLNGLHSGKIGFHYKVGFIITSCTANSPQTLSTASRVLNSCKCESRYDDFNRCIYYYVGFN